MRKCWSICLLILLASTLLAQNTRRIKEDPAYIWGEGTGQDYESVQRSAIDALIRKLAATDLLDLPQEARLAVWKTYRSDIIAVSLTAQETGSALRYIAWNDIDKIFARRKKLAKDLSARAAADPVSPEALTCAEWAATLAMALPEDIPMQEELSSLRKRMRRTDPVPIPGLQYINREVESIRQALGSHAFPDTLAKDPVMTKTTPEESPSRPPMESLGSDPLRMTVLAETLQDKRVDELIPSLVRPAPASYKASPETQWSYFLLLRLTAIPSLEPGVFFGAKGTAMGAYLSAGKGFDGVRPAYTADSEGRTDFGTLWASGKRAFSRYSLSAGVLADLTGRITGFAGTGYGKADCLWEDTSGQWARITDKSSAGILVEAGIIYTADKLAFSAGLSSISLDTIGVSAGIGLHF